MKRSANGEVIQNGIVLEKSEHDVAEKVMFARVAVAARMLSVSRRKAYELIASGELPSRRFGSSIRVPIAAIEKMAAEAAQGEGRRSSRAAR